MPLKSKVDKTKSSMYERDGLSRELAYLRRLQDSRTTIHWPPKPTSKDLHLHLQTAALKLQDIQNAMDDPHARAEMSRALGIVSSLLQQYHH